MSFFFSFHLNSNKLTLTLTLHTQIIWELNLVHILSLFVPLRDIRAQGAKPGVVLWALCFLQSVLFYAPGISSAVTHGSFFLLKLVSIVYVCMRMTDTQRERVCVRACVCVCVCVWIPLFS